MMVHVDCPGCVRKIRKALQDLKGIDNVEIDVGMQKETVTGSVNQKKVLKRVGKTGRRAELWQLPCHPVGTNHNYTVPDPLNCGGGPAVAAYYATAQPPVASHYNYYKHGYDYSQNHAHFHSYSSHEYGQSRVFGSWAGIAFSDESAHGCFIM